MKCDLIYFINKITHQVLALQSVPLYFVIKLHSLFFNEFVDAYILQAF